MAPVGEWLTTTEAAAELGISIKTLFRYIKRGLLTVQYVNPRLALIRRDELRKVRRPKMGRPKKPKP
jgi:predicted site-specific integrase-resolvase